MDPMRQELFVLTAVAALAASPLFGTDELAAQGRGNSRQSRDGYSTAGDRIPPGQLPPAGMCRVWVDGVPPGRQAAPTDCTTAQRELRNAPRNARIIYG